MLLLFQKLDCCLCHKNLTHPVTSSGLVSGFQTSAGSRGMLTHGHPKFCLMFRDGSSPAAALRGKLRIPSQTRSSLLPTTYIGRFCYLAPSLLASHSQTNRLFLPETQHHPSFLIRLLRLKFGEYASGSDLTPRSSFEQLAFSPKQLKKSPSTVQKYYNSVVK